MRLPDLLRPTCTQMLLAGTVKPNAQTFQIWLAPFRRSLETSFVSLMVSDCWLQRSVHPVFFGGLPGQ